MFQRFTGEARRVVVTAQNDARQRCADRIGTEHLLMGLLDTPTGVTADILSEFGVRGSDIGSAIDRAYDDDRPDPDALATIGIDLDEVRRQVEDAFGPGALDRVAERRRGAKRRWAHLPFSRRAKQALEASLRQALWLRHKHIGTEHILLGLLAVQDGLAARLLAEHGVTFEQARAAVCGRGRQTG